MSIDLKVKTDLKINVKKILSYLIFFPSITFSLTQAEIFPWAILLLIYVHAGIPRSLLVILGMFFLSAVYTIYFTKAPFFEIIRSIAAYLNPVLIFFFIIRMKQDNAMLQNLYKIARHVFLFLTVLGVLQFLHVLFFLNPLFSLLVPRGSGEAYGGGRGVLLLSSEPSRASYEFLFLYIFFKATSSFTKRINLLLDLGLLVFQVIIIKSGTGLFLTAMYFLFSYGYKLILLFSPAIVVASYITVQSRAFELVKSLITSVNFNTALYFVVNQSGFRLVSIVSGFLYGFTHIFGGGIGNWDDASVTAMKSLGIDARNFAFFNSSKGAEFFGIRPTSFLSSFTLDFGVVGLVLLLVVLGRTVHKYWRVSYHFKKMIFFMLLFFLFFGDTGNPVPWIAAALFFTLPDVYERSIAAAI